MMPHFTQRKDGLGLLTYTIPSSDIVNLGFFLKAGSRHESAATNGVCHFLEHMAYKGTQSRSAERIAKEIDNLGGSSNAYTSSHSVFHYVSGLKTYAEQFFAILADITFQPTYPQEELEKERQVILQEIAHAQDDPDDVCYDTLMAASYPDHALGRPIMGTAETLGALDQAALHRQRRYFYRPDQVIVAASGGITPEDLEKLAARFIRFEDSPAPFEGSSAPVFQPRIKTVYRDIRQLRCCFGFSGFAADHKHFHALQVFSAFFGGGMSSRLFQTIREKLGLAYHIYTNAQFWQDCGLFSITCGTSDKDLPLLTQALSEEIQKVLEGAILKEELERTRLQAQTSLLFRQESSKTLLSQYLYQILFYGRTLSKEEMLENVRSVTDRHVKDAALELFTPGRFSAAIVGALDGDSAQQIVRNLI